MKLFPIISALLLILGANFYVFYRLWAMLPTGVGRVLLVVFGIVALSSFVLVQVVGNNLPLPLAALMYRVGTTWFFIFIYLLIIFLLLELIRVTGLLPVARFMYESWYGFGVLAGALTLILTGGYIVYLHKARVELSLTVNKEVGAERSLKIVAISDLHLGYGIGRKEFEGWVELINKEHPDIVLIAGDAIDNSVRPLYERGIAESFRQINANYGVYASPGNHEYITGISNSLAFLKEAGVTVLRDSVAFINNTFYIAGRDDRSNSARKSVEELTDTLDKSKLLILLDHQPYHLEQAEKNGVDLQISGHTHHGQIVPISWITEMIYEKAHGYLKKGDSHIYVSSGLGLWGGKFRIGTRSEYVVIHLTPK
ncbi:3' 5'-cyclic adenosine monophosphate phosphodiesterase CpdA [termite gut metagenome]|uniref:3' 5'-cyclic adenosine monophosphate phosphodiesterase CpdA n=1 Tax=termite gut metagenome TaxID=433724 RepID=A0A5J4SPK9_9ZZZZ